MPPSVDGQPLRRHPQRPRRRGRRVHRHRPGHPRAAKDVTDAIAAVLAKTDTRTRDLGGTSTKRGPRSAARAGRDRR
ncbi:hypothetical protein CNQ36_00765 [Streptomyces fungicidicus]|uniref:Uncharacterized protein n=1 Tax=Streptomyces fungicidicus TaxID=68203 RepID=A0A494UWT1_9ACTN|nr:hypothetical protein CNQ36_00765 [Streptomyces fungicidicus]